MKLLKAEETLILMALPIESQRTFENAGVEVHYCGIGKVNAAFKATELLVKQNFKQVLNLGTAGSHKFETHSLIECIGFVQRDMDLSPLGFPRGETPQDAIAGKLLVDPISQLPKGICGTGDVFEISTPKLECDLVDMEAYAIAKVCRKLGVGFHSFKYITDGSDDKAHKDWIENLKPASKALFNLYQEIVR
jgi:adenosylhomocysteine nucleosidase